MSVESVTDQASFRDWLLRYGAALGGVVVLLLVRLWLQPILGNQARLIAFTLPVTIAAVYGGLAPGLLATLAGALAGTWLFVGPAVMTDAGAVANVAIFVAVGTGISVVGGRLRQSRALLEASETRLRGLSDAVPQILWTSLPDGGRDFLNSRWTDYTGVPVEASLDLGWLEQAHPDDRDRVRVAWLDAVRAGQAFEAEYRLRRHDGAYRWFSVRAVPVRDGAGRVGRWAGASTDVHDAREAHERLKAQSARLDRILATAPGVVLAFRQAPDGGWSFPYASPRVEDIYGLTPAQLAADAAPVFQMMPPDDASRVSAAILESARTLEPWRAQFRVTRPDRATVWVEGHSVPVREDDGGTLWYGFVHDVTAQRQAEETAREWQRAFEQSAVGIALADAQTECFRSVNEAFARRLGYTRDEMAGMPIARIYSSELQEAQSAFVSRSDGAGHGVFETEHLRRDGTRIPVLVDLTTVRDEQARPHSRVAIVQDLTARREAEADAARSADALRTLNAALEERVQTRTAQLQAANEELEAFSYSVSHDLRAPLRGIDGWSLALLEDYGATLPGQARTFLDRVRAETARMGLLIDDLLDLSRVTRRPLHVSRVDLTALASGVAARLREAHPDRRLVFRIAPRLDVEADPRLLELLVTNLLDNAVKFTATREEAHIDVGVLVDARETAWYVADNGVGFDPAHADTLFGAFARLHRASEFPGTGIGLATVRRIAARHGGRVWASAQPDRGATFWFTLGASA
ncbi:MAG: PAS domain S-box protein [Vicinamibacterales bacterium]